MRLCGCCVIECVKTCYICKQTITNIMPYVKCDKCNIMIHNSCYMENYKINQNCCCPDCQSVGTIGKDICFENIDEYEL